MFLLLSGMTLVLGDARVEMEREFAEEKKQNFGVLVINVFSSDAVPMHLMMREAFELYREHLDPGHAKSSLSRESNRETKDDTVVTRFAVIDLFHFEIGPKAREVDTCRGADPPGCPA